MNKKLIVSVLIFLLFSLGVSTVFAETAVYHGADTVFSAEGIAVFWAILKDKKTDSSTVYMEIAELNSGGRPACRFKTFDLRAADVFSGEEKYVVEPRVLKSVNLVKEDGKAFDTMSKRRFLFYKEQKPGKDTRPDMEIYYIGVPDATPEFLKEEQIDKFFKDSLVKLETPKKS